MTKRRRQTAFSECEPRAWAHAGSRAGSFRVLAGPGTTAGRSLSSRASSLASLFICVVGRCLIRESNKRLGLALMCVGLERAFAFPLLLDLGFQLEEGVASRVGLRRGRWGRHRCRARIGFAVALRVLLLLSQFNARAATGVQVSVLAVIQDHVSCSGQRVMRCSDATRVILQASLAIELAVRH